MHQALLGGPMLHPVRVDEGVGHLKSYGFKV